MNHLILKEIIISEKNKTDTNYLSNETKDHIHMFATPN